MYDYTIEYYFERHHTGELNYGATRTGLVRAKTLAEAEAKIKVSDPSYICTANVSFEEVRNEYTML